MTYLDEKEPMLSFFEVYNKSKDWVCLIFHMGYSRIKT